jgi:1-acyl-sn-glycerol-3-phosphate acyltransferase
VFKAPVIGPVARRIGFIPVNRGAANAAEALGPAAEALAAGELVAIFPEGRLTRDPDRWPEKAKTGAVRLALQTGAPIVPVALEGAYRVVGRRKVVSSLLRNVLLRPKVATAVGEPIDVRGLLQGPQTPDEIRRVTDVVWSRLIDLVEQLRGQEAPDAVGVEPDAVTPV